MKKVISFIIITTVLLQSFLLYGCEDGSKEQTETMLHDNYDEIYEIINSAETSEDAAAYLAEWAGSMDIKSVRDANSNIIMTSDPSPGYENADSTLFQCTIDLDNPEHTAVCASIAMYIVSESTQHGLLRVIFTSDFDNIKNISDTYLLGADNFISLDWCKKYELLVGSAGSEYYSITHNLEWESPSYTKAYEISVYIPEDIPYSDLHLHRNPITYIGDILARAKSDSILLEVAGFNGGESADTYPTAVSCTVLINQNDFSKFAKSINETKEEFDNMYADENSGYFFSFNEVEAPDKVISYEDTANLISFLYTCIDGTYLKDDAGEVIAAANVGKIRTTSGNLEIEVCAYSKSSAILAEMSSEFNTICSLCDISYSVKSGMPVWENRIETDYYSEDETLENGYATASSTLIDDLDVQMKEIIGKESRKIRTFGETACSLAARRNKKMNAVGFGVEKDEMLEQTEILINYLSALKNKNE